MTRFFVCCFFGAFSIGLSAQTLDQFFQQSNDFLKKHVQEDGLVNYSAIQKDPQLLDHLVQTITSPPELTEQPATQKAFWINAYNLLVINNVVKHYPAKSVQDIPQFFQKKIYTIKGVKYSINGIEKRFLLDIFADARLHFVLVCAAKGCPPLANFAYLPDQVETQLQQQTTAALQLRYFFNFKKSKKTAYISEIFKWYEKDFRQAGGIQYFLKKYAHLPDNFDIKYQAYDWTLNDPIQQFNTNNQPRYLASTLLKKQQTELKLFNALYTQKSYDGFKILNSRSTYFSTFGQFLYGLNTRVNIGFDLVYKANVINDFVDNSPFRALLFQSKKDHPIFQCDNAQHNTSNGNLCTTEMNLLGDTLRFSDGTPLRRTSQHGLAHFGPKFKLQPIKKWAQLSLQQTLYIPIEKTVDGQFISFTQLFFDYTLNAQHALFIEASLWTPIHPEFKLNPFFKLFYSYFPTDKWTIYAMANIPAEYGLGTKYLVHPRLEIELLYTHYLPITSIVGHTRPRTFNLAFRYTNF